MLGFPTLARAWFSISLVLYSIFYFIWDCIVATIFMSILSFILFMFMKAMSIVCSSLIFGVARLWKPCICSYRLTLLDHGWAIGSMWAWCLDIYLSTDGLICREVVDHVGDSCVESFAVHPSYILMLVEPGREG
jgi:hypothetical protein